MHGRLSRAGTSSTCRGTLEGVSRHRVSYTSPTQACRCDVNTLRCRYCLLCITITKSRIVHNKVHAFKEMAHDRRTTSLGTHLPTSVVPHDCGRAAESQAMQRLTPPIACLFETAEHITAACTIWRHPLRDTRVP